MATLSDQIDKVTSTTEADRVTEADTEDGPAVVGRAQVDERLAARRRLEARTAAATRSAAAPTRVIAPDRVESTTAVGPRPRASLLASMSLILGTGAALAVLTGVLAGPGVGLGLIAAFIGAAGIAATSRPHVAGKGDALLGMTLGLGAVVIGTLAITGLLPWLSSDSDQVMRVREWLEAQASWLFPSAS